ncbi:MAG: TauD/TfdA family dioxygenase [Archangium sp.]
MEPFGLRVEFPSGTRFDSIDIGTLRGWLDEHRVVQLRGLASEPPHQLATLSRKLGPLQPWPFGAVHELKQKPRTDNYLYTEHAVPLHWDGAFADAVPHWLVFECVQAPPANAGGETNFIDTKRVLERATPEQRVKWATARFRYTTEKKAHYGGTFTSPVIAKHPTLGFDVIRYAEPVEDLNPVSVEPIDGTDAATMAELKTALYAKEVELAVPWQPGDYVIADNHALLHGRRAFTDGAPRHLYRVNVLDEDRRWWATLRAAWRVRRPEFFRAELPILLIPALLSAPSVSDLWSWRFLEGALLFFLLFNVGDMINCWFDRDVDLHRKTHLAEAIARVGRNGLLAQIIISALFAAGLGVHLALTLNRSWLAPAGVLGAILGAGYTAPPLRLKSRGVLQLAAYVGLLFIGPMVMISGLFVDQPSLELILASTAFGVMQTGVLLVNTAEDLDEDEREGIRTVAVVFQALGTIKLARLLVLVGAVSFAMLLGSPLALPLLALAAWNLRWLSVLAKKMEPLDETGRRAAIRDQGKHVPTRIEAGAWLALFAAIPLTARG